MTVYCLFEWFHERYILRNVFTNLQEAKNFIKDVEWDDEPMYSMWLTTRGYPWKIEEFPLLGAIQ